jgi:hypothetical protein
LSELINDKKVLEDGRKSTLKGAEVPLRDRIVQKLYDQLVEEGIGVKMVNIWQRGNADRTVWLERQKTYLASWDEHLVNDTEGPFGGQSNLHIPMPFIVSKTMHARFLQALLQQDPPFSVKARNEGSIDRVQNVSDVMRYNLVDWCNYNKGIDATADKFVWEWVTTGVGLMKARWDCKYTRYIDVVPTKKKGVPVIKTIDGKQQAIPTIKVEEKEVAVTKKVFEGAVYDPIHPEHLLIVGGGGDPDIADLVQHHYFLTASEMWTMVDRKIFNEDAVKQTLQGGENKQSPSSSGSLSDQRTRNAGSTSVDNEQDLDRYEVLECYLSYDVDGSGINSEIVVWVHKGTNAVLRATYLHRISKAGERPFIKADFHLRADQEYGVGIVELLYPLSQEMDAMHNMRIDAGLMSTMPFGFYRATSGIDPSVIKFEPGSLIPVDNPATDVFFPNLGNRTVFGMQEEQAIQSMIERLTSISDLNLGLINGQGATRTATGARAVVGEASSNLDVHLRRLNRGWKKLLRYSLHMLQQRMPAGLAFRVTGDDGQNYWKTMASTDDIAGDYDIEISANSSTSNQQIQQQNAQDVLQLVSNPLAIQMGCVGPGQFFEACKAVLISRGIKDWSKYLQKPQGYDRIYTPLQEMDMVLMGIDVPIAPNSDHQGFIDLLQHFMDDEYLHGQFNEQQIAMLAAQAKKHEMMMQALKQAQAQANNAQQMQMNAQMSQQQAPMSGAAPSPVAVPGQ